MAAVSSEGQAFLWGIVIVSAGPGAESLEAKEMKTRREKERALLV